VDEGVRAAVVQGTRDREEPAMLPHGKTIAHVLGMVASAVALTALFGFILVVTAIDDFPPTPVLQLGAEERTLGGESAQLPAVPEQSGTVAAPVSRSLPVAHRDTRRLRDRFTSQHAVTSSPVIVDPRQDRRVDLMDMAISIRWHRGTTSDLPPGSE
jgi:hypothetical protein